VITSAIGFALWLVSGRTGFRLPGSNVPGRLKTFSSNVAESVAWSPDGRYLAAGYLMDTSARIWDVEGGQTVEVLGSFRGGVSLVSWSPNGKYLVTASSEPNRTLRVWDTSTWEAMFVTDPVANTDKTTTSITSVSWSPDSSQIAVGLATTTGAGVDYLRQIDTKSLLKIYDVPGGSNSATLVYPSISGIGSVDWSPDGNTIVFTVDPDDSAWYATVVLLWDLSAGDGPSTDKNTWQLVREDALITLTDVRWSPDGKYIAGNSGDNSVKVFEASTGDLEHVLPADGEISHVDWSPDGTRIIASVRGGAAKGADSEYVQVWHVSSEQTVAIFKSGPVLHALAWSPDSKRIATSSGMIAAGDISIWGFDNPAIVPTVTAIPSAPNLQPGSISVLGSHSDWVMTVAWSPSGEWLASGGNDNRVRVWEVTTGRLISTLRLYAWVDSLAWSPDGKYLATAAFIGGPSAHSVQVWDTATWQLNKEWNLGGKVVDTSWSPDGKNLAVGRGNSLEDPEGWLIVLDVESGEELKALGHPEMATQVAWSADGKYVAVASDRGTADSKPSVWIWASSSWQAVAKVPFNIGIGDLEWSPDSELLAVVLGDQRVGLFDVSTMSQDHVEIDDYTRDVSWTPDKRLVTTSGRSALLLWDLSIRKITIRREVNEGVSAVAVSPDGRYIALGGWDGFVRILVIR
jgi:WD40 repeat protein